MPAFRLTVQQLLLLVLFSALAARSASAQTTTAAPPEPLVRVGCVDLSYVAANSRQGKIAFGQLQELSKKKEMELAERAKQLQTQQGQLQKEESSMNPVQRAELERTFQKTRLEFDRFREDSESEVQQFAQRVERDLRARLFPIVEELSKEKGLHLVFTADSPGLVWFSRSIDISSEIVQRLDNAK